MKINIKDKKLDFINKPKKLIFIKKLEKKINIIEGKNLLDDECYAFISYTWSDLDKLNNFEYNIFIDNLYNCLNSLNIKYFWMDRICINQNNENEKSEEINKMRTYIKCSIMTIIVLDPIKSFLICECKKNSKQLYKYITEYDYIFSINKMDKYKELNELKNKISNKVKKLISYYKILMNSKWFTRVWTFQESLLSNNCIFLSGSEWIEVEDFKNIIKIILKSISRSNFSGFIINELIIESNIWENKLNTIQIDKDIELINLVNGICERNCTVIHDKIYCLSILLPNCNIQVDYNISLIELHSIFINKCIESGYISLLIIEENLGINNKLSTIYNFTSKGKIKSILNIKTINNISIKCFPNGITKYYEGKYLKVKFMKDKFTNIFSKDKKIGIKNLDELILNESFKKEEIKNKILLLNKCFNILPHNYDIDNFISWNQRISRIKTETSNGTCIIGKCLCGNFGITSKNWYIDMDNHNNNCIIPKICNAIEKIKNLLNLGNIIVGNEDINYITDLFSCKLIKNINLTKNMQLFIVDSGINIKYLCEKNNNNFYCIGIVKRKEINISTFIKPNYGINIM